ncbi:MAG: transposase [bacterium]|nr:transposase [bacterium]
MTDRTYVCTQCGTIIDRDLNAAINFDTIGRAHPEPTDACGLDGSVVADSPS